MLVLFNQCIKALIFLTCLSSNVFAEPGSDVTLGRSLQGMAQKWAIQEPHFDYVDKTFMLRWDTSDYIQDRFATYTIYDGWDCKEGSNDITGAISDFYNNNVLFQNLGLQPDNKTPNNPFSNGEGVRSFNLNLAAQATIGEAPILYYTSDQNQYTAEINFCVRFSLYNDDPDAPDAVEVNFQETLINFTVDLTDGFEIGTINVKPNDRFEKTAFVACEIIGYECDENNEPLPNPGYLRNQGSMVRVCVRLSDESKKEGLKLDRIVWFYFLREHPSGDVLQNAIVRDSREAPNLLAEYDCMRGVDVCPFNVILRADFFAWPGIGVVRGIGEGVCMFGGGAYIVEDVPKKIGDRLGWEHHKHEKAYAKQAEIVGFPVGTTVSYIDVDGTNITTVVADEDYSIVLYANNDEAKIRAALDTLTLTSILHSDVDFELRIIVTTGGDTEHLYVESVDVLAVADPPAIEARDLLVLNEQTTIPYGLNINPDRSADEDNSESLSVRITIPHGTDGFGPIGEIIEFDSTPNAALTDRGNGVYVATATGPDPATREATLDAFMNDFGFVPRSHWSGVLSGEDGIKIEAISTEANEVAPANSRYEGTWGDMDTRIEIATTYTSISVNPVLDDPYLSSTETIVQENKLDSFVDVDVVIPIGQNLGMKVDDLDGSQTIDATLTGFPTNAQVLTFTESVPGVTAEVDIPTGTILLSGDNVADVLTVLESLTITLAHDDDKNFRIQITGTSTDTNGVTEVSGPFYLEHQVIVQAVVDNPTLIVGGEVKPLASESSLMENYPVTVNLNDVDGSETYQDQEILITLSTVTTIASGADPVVNLGDSPGITQIVADTTVVGNVKTSKVTLKGDGADLENAMDNLMIQPGDHNGEDIFVQVSVTAIESNPSENGPNEIAVLNITNIKNFTVPIEPMIQGTPTLEVGGSVFSGPEDQVLPLGQITVGLDGNRDTDESEIYYVEVLTTSYPPSTTFIVNGGAQTGTIIDGWLRLADSEDAPISIKPPKDFSGIINLSVRGHIIDYTTNGNAYAITPPQTIEISILPVADDITYPGKTVGVEDLGSLNFGATLATSGLQPFDDGTSAGNNPESETISQVVFVVPEDEEEITYTISGQYAPSGDGTFAGKGTAMVTLNVTGREYVITSTIISESSDIAGISQEDREAAEQDIRDTLATFFVEIGPEHIDLNGVITVIVTTLDVNLGEYNSDDYSFNHDVVIQAVADAGELIVQDPSPVLEDVENIPLNITVGPSDDTDGSESLSIKITVPKEDGKVIGTIVGDTPENVQMTKRGRVYTIVAIADSPIEQTDLLNSFVSNGGGLEFEPRLHWSGNNTLKVDLISTEAAAGDELAGDQYGGNDKTSKTETVTDWINISVLPQADLPDLGVKAEAVGNEDTRIYVPAVVTLIDTDGSETYIMQIDGTSVPDGARLFGQGGSEIFKSDGVYTLESADIEVLEILPPLHWSSALQGDIVLATTTIVSDGPSTMSADMDIPVRIIGVSDPPVARTVHVDAVEDVAYPLGEAIEDLAGILVDADGSETLSLVVGGLQAGTMIQTDGPDEITYIGNGDWRVPESSIPTMTLTPRKHFSGENPYPNLLVRAMSQEMDGNQSMTPWAVTINVFPAVDGFTDDWEPEVKVTEEENEVEGVGISLSNVQNFTLIDNDGSESVVDFTFDMSSLIQDAKIGQRLIDLTGVADADLDTLISQGYIQGLDLEYDTYDPATGSIVVQPSRVGNLVLSAELFLDSNEDFSIPVTALVEDTATIDGTVETDTLVESGEYKVKIKGTADVPTVGGESAIGKQIIPVSILGDSTDTDVQLGRDASELVYYIIKPEVAQRFTFIDINNNVVGFLAGAGSWLIPQSDLEVANEAGGLFFSADDQFAEVGNVTVLFHLMSVARENDGDTANNVTNFTVTCWDEADTGDGSGAGDGVPEGFSGHSEDVTEIPPEVPDVFVGNSEGIEDEPATLVVNATAAINDETNPTVSVIFTNLPEGTKLTGDYYHNQLTGNYAALAEDVMNGNVKIRAPKHFSGDLTVTVKVAAVNNYYLSTETEEFPVDIYFDPVADNPDIDLPGSVTGNENEPVDITFSFSLEDDDGSEEIGPYTYVQTCSQASMSFPIVSPSDEDAVVAGVSMEGLYRVPSTGSSFSLQPDQYWHGKCTVTVWAQTIEKFDDQDADYTTVRSKSITANIVAVANPPILTAPGSIQGPEDTYIPIPGLSAVLLDNVVENGHEILSATFTDVPEYSLFNYGTNTGNGGWSIPIGDLSSLQYKPPPHYAGSFSMVFSGFSMESSNGSEASSTEVIAVTVTPVADPFIIVADNVELFDGGSVPLTLNIAMEDTRGTLSGELPPEVITLTFTSVPAGLVLTASFGGTVTAGDPATGTWTFSGSEAQANSLVLSGTTGSIGVFTVEISGITTDGPSTLADPITDNFVLIIEDTNINARRYLDGNETLPITFDEDSYVETYGAITPYSPGVRNCDDDASVLWGTDEAAYNAQPDMVTILHQNHYTVTFTVTQLPFNSASINWMGVLYAQEADGDNKCVMEPYSPNQQVRITANCYDFRSKVYLFVNVNDDSVEESAYRPRACELPENVGNGKTIAYEISVPCSACIDESVSLAGAERRMAVSSTGKMKSQHSDRVLQHMIKRRSLQDDEESFGSQFETDFLAIGDETLSSAVSFWSFGTTLLLSAVVATTLMISM